jgi:hypothetical protein
MPRDSNKTHDVEVLMGNLLIDNELAGITNLEQTELGNGLWFESLSGPYSQIVTDAMHYLVPLAPAELWEEAVQIAIAQNERLQAISITQSEAAAIAKRARGLRD